MFTGFWTGAMMGSSVMAIAMGLYGMRRHHYRSDFTYNKYHFGVFINVAAAMGMSMSAKMPKPYQTGMFFLASIAMTSFPGYIDGLREMHNLEDAPYDSSLVRRFGFYALLVGYSFLLYKNRQFLPFVRPLGK